MFQPYNNKKTRVAQDTDNHMNTSAYNINHTLNQVDYYPEEMHFPAGTNWSSSYQRRFRISLHF